MRKKTQQEVEQVFNKYGYKVIEKYQSAFKQIECEKDGYLYFSRYIDISMGKMPTLWGINNFGHLQKNLGYFIEKNKSFSEIQDIKIIQKDKRKRVLCTLRCPCGKIFNRVLDEVVYKKSFLCLNCSREERGKKKRKSKGELISYFLSMGYKVIDKNRDFNSQERVEVEDNCGYRGFVSSSGLHSGKGMSKFDIRSNKKNYIYNVNNYIKLNNLPCICLSFENANYVKQGLKFRCSCGKEFVTSITSFQNGKMRCECCTKSISRYEFIFKNFLEEKKIEYIYQYSFNECRDVLPLPFDFFIKDKEVLVEIDGEGHYKPCNFNQISNKDAIKTFEITKNHDIIKNNFCKEQNIKLLRISYKEILNGEYEKIFLSFIKE